MSSINFRVKSREELCLLRTELIQGTYRPLPLRQIRIKKPKGGFRVIGIPCVRDRVVGRAIVNTLNTLFEPIWSDSSHGYRRKRSIRTAATVIRDVIPKHSFVTKIDIKGFFDNINHERLLSLVGQFIHDPQTAELFRTTIRYQRWQSPDASIFTQGVCQGMPLSPLAANLYLHKFDLWVAKYHQSIRYADDIIIFTQSRAQAENARDVSIAFLDECLNLECSENKCEIVPIAEGFTYLGLGFRYQSILLTEEAVDKLIYRIDEICEASNNCFEFVDDATNCVRAWANAYCIAEGNHIYDRAQGAVGHRVVDKLNRLTAECDRALRKTLSIKLKHGINIRRVHAQAQKAFRCGSDLELDALVP